MLNKGVVRVLLVLEDSISRYFRTASGGVKGGY